jgi:nucleotide-binding universal stress UspA family protein
MYERILVATDGSPPAGAVDLAEELGATLHAVSVVDTMAYGIADVRSEIAIDALEENAASHVEEAASAAEATGVDCETEVLHGDPADAIGGYAEDNDIDLIVVGTHGRRGVSRFLLGSVAERVARTAPGSVLIVRTEVVED